MTTDCLNFDASELHLIHSFKGVTSMAKLEVLYNSECPICDREIKHYKKISNSDISYVPISPASLNSWGLSENQAAKKLHARLGGKKVVGVDAFVEIWAKLPYYWILATFVKLPPVKFLADNMYSIFLAPMLFSLHKFRQKRASKKEE
jgi:predicted DCC family thiol-disulfide oxidoreductase YuxK